MNERSEKSMSVVYFTALDDGAYRVGDALRKPAGTYFDGCFSARRNPDTERQAMPKSAQTFGILGRR